MFKSLACRFSFVAIIYVWCTLQESNRSRRKEKKSEPKTIEAGEQKPTTSSGFDKYIESLDNDSGDPRHDLNSHEHISNSQEDISRTNGSFPLPGFEENEINGHDDRNNTSNSHLNNGYRDGGSSLFYSKTYFIFQIYLALALFC